MALNFPRAGELNMWRPHDSHLATPPSGYALLPDPGGDESMMGAGATQKRKPSIELPTSGESREVGMALP